MKSTAKKISGFAVAEIVLIVILAVIMLTMLALNIFFKDENSIVSVFGYSFYNTKDVTMLKNIPANTLIIAKASEKENVREGSAVLCRIGSSVTLIKVDSIEDTDDGRYYIVRFDYAAENEAVRISEDSIIAKAVWQIDGFGRIINFAGSTAGIIISVVIPLLFIIAIQVARIVSIRRMENEAASIDDIDDIITSRDEENAAPVTFTEPKVVKDVPDGSTAEDKLSAAGDGTHSDRQESSAPNGFPLYTYDRIAKEKKEITQDIPDRGDREPAMAGVGKAAKTVNGAAAGVSPEVMSADEFFESYVPKQDRNAASDGKTAHEEEARVVFTPHFDNILPKNVRETSNAAENVITDASRPREPRRRPASFDESVRSYLDKTYVPEEHTDEIIVHETAPAAETAPTVPAEQTDAGKAAAAVNVPAENTREAAPSAPSAPKKKKKKADTSFDELMSMIDSEQSRLNKK